MGAVELIGAVIRQAIIDYQDGVAGKRPRWMSKTEAKKKKNDFESAEWFLFSKDRGALEWLINTTPLHKVLNVEYVRRVAKGKPLKSMQRVKLYRG